MSRVYWPTMGKDVKAFHISCHICSRKSENPPAPKPYDYVSVATATNTIQTTDTSTTMEVQTVDQATDTNITTCDQATSTEVDLIYIENLLKKAAALFDNVVEPIPQSKSTSTPQNSTVQQDLITQTNTSSTLNLQEVQDLGLSIKEETRDPYLWSMHGTDFIKNNLCTCS